MTEVSVTLNSPTLEFLREQLFPGDGNEAGAIALMGTNDIRDGLCGRELRYLSHSVCRIPQADVVSASSQHFSWRKDTFLTLLKRAMKEGLAIAFVHSHRGANSFFSALDDQNDRDVAELVAHRTCGSTDFLSMVIDEPGRVVARKVAHRQPPVSARVCATFGPKWKWHYPSTHVVDTPVHDRQVLAFGPEFLAALTGIRILIIGAGATGSAMAVLLARNGAADIVLVDPDVVEHTNLSRLHGATVQDAEESRSKVEVLARHIREFGLGTTVTGFQSWIGDPTVRHSLKSADLVFGCTDDHAGRLFANRYSYFYNTPFIDLGISIDPKRIREGFIVSADTRVSVVGPGSPCLVCRRIVDPIRARDEQLARDCPRQYDQLLAEGYVDTANIPNPAVIALTTGAACMAVDEVTARLTHYRRTTDNRVRKHRLMKDSFPGATANRDCPLCGTDTNWGRGDVMPFLDRAG